MQDENYQARVTIERENYQNTLNVHELPDIFHYWSNTYVRPKLEALGIGSSNEMFKTYLEDQCARAKNVRAFQFVLLEVCLSWIVGTSAFAQGNGKLNPLDIPPPAATPCQGNPLDCSSPVTATHDASLATFLEYLFLRIGNIDDAPADLQRREADVVKLFGLSSQDATALHTAAQAFHNGLVTLRSTPAVQKAQVAAVIKQRKDLVIVLGDQFLKTVSPRARANMMHALAVGRPKLSP